MDLIAESLSDFTVMLLECKVLNLVEERDITAQIFTFTYILVICIVGAVLILNNVSKGEIQPRTSSFIILYDWRLV